MKIARLVGVMLVAVLAMSLVAASASSAAPTFKPASGSLTAKGGTSVLKGGSDTVTCAKNEAAGAISSASLVGPFTIHFLECTSSTTGSTAKCSIKNLNGPAEGLIITSTVHGVLGTVLPSGEAGLLILPTSGKVFVTLEKNACTPETKVSGSVAGAVSPTGKSQTTGKLVLKTVGGTGKEEIAKIDTATGLAEPELVAFTETATETTEDSITFSAPVEVT
jgi:hypothetical protein